MRYACTVYDDVISAEEAQKGQEYYCYACKEPVTLKKGRINAPHFAHQKYSECGDGWSHSNGKTEWHIFMQSLFETQEFPMENACGERHIADAVIDDTVFEFQNSKMSSDEAKRRTMFYISMEYRVVWVINVSEQFKSGNLYSIYGSEYRQRGLKIEDWVWKNPIKMFYWIPLSTIKDRVRVLLYWSKYEVSASGLDGERKNFLGSIINYEDIYEENEDGLDGDGKIIGAAFNRFQVYKKIEVNEHTKLNADSIFDSI